MKLWTPAYGKRMLDARLAGNEPTGTVLISMGLWFNRSWPPSRLIVIPDEAPIGRLDLRCVRGLFCELVLATEPLTPDATRSQMTAVRKQRARAQQLVNLIYAEPVDGAVDRTLTEIHSMTDVRAKQWALAIPGREPVWHPADEQQMDHWHRCGVVWSDELRRRAA